MICYRIDWRVFFLDSMDELESLSESEDESEDVLGLYSESEDNDFKSEDNDCKSFVLLLRLLFEQSVGVFLNDSKRGR